MNQERTQLDKIFADAFERLEESPPPHVWNGISESLDAASKLAKLKYYWMAAASVAVIASFFAGFYFSKSKLEKNTASDHLSIKKPTELQVHGNNQRPVPEKQPLQVQTKEIKKEPVHFNAIAEIKPDTQKTVPQNEVIPIVDVVPKSYFAEPLEFSSVPVLALMKDSKIQDDISGKLKVTDRVDVSIIPPVQQSKWEITINTAPVYTYRSLGSGTRSFDSKQEIYFFTNNNSDRAYYNNNETGTAGFSGNIDVFKNINNRLSVGSGLNILTLGLMSKEIYLSDNQTNPSEQSYILNTSTGLVTADNQSEVGSLVRNTSSLITDLGSDGSIMCQNSANIIQRFDYFEVPFQARYKLFDYFLKCSVQGAVKASYLMSNSASLVIENSNVTFGETKQARSLVLGGNIGLNLMFPLSENSSLSFTPAYRFTLTSAVKANGMGFYPYAIGLLTGINTSF